MQSFQTVAAYRVVPELVGRGTSARRLRAGATMGAFFPLLGAQPLLGRLFSADDDAASAGPLAVISETVWRRQFGGDPDVLGRTIDVGDAHSTVVGVLPDDFSGTELRRVDVWTLADSRRAGTTNWNILGRLRPGVTLGAASAEAAAVFRRTSDAAPKWYREAALRAAPIRYDDTGREPFEATMARWLAGVSLVILLIALANVVNLLLVRLARRRRELAVRIALGSGRGRLVRLFAFEGAFLAVAGGAVGLWVVQITAPLVQHALFAGDATWSFSLLDARLLIAAVLLVGATALCIGIVPAVQGVNPRLVAMLRAGTQAGGAGSTRTRAALTLVQASFSVVLLVCAGLFLRSLERVGALHLGVDRDRVLTANAQLPPWTTYTSAAIVRYLDNERDVYRRLVDAVRHLPGVERAAIAIGLPLDGGTFSATVWISGRDSIPTLPGGGPFASTVGPDYFATIGTRLLRGRVFTAQDREGTEPVLIVGETMARSLWPNGDAIGQCAGIGLRTAPCARVVGVVEDVHRVGLRDKPSLQYYMPLGQQHLFGGATLLVRPTRSSPVSSSTLQQTMLRVDPSIRSVDVKGLRESLDGEMHPLRLGMVTFGLSSGLALVVALLGLYSLMSSMVAWRTREIGIRHAIGATDAQIVRMVVASGTSLAATGVALGLALVIAGGHWIEPWLFETSAVDPLVLGGVAVALLVVALLAGVLPARRAVQISPTEALRAE